MLNEAERNFYLMGKLKCMKRAVQNEAAVFLVDALSGYTVQLAESEVRG